MLTIVGQVLAQATPAADKGGVATAGAQLPEAGINQPLVILTTLALILIAVGVIKFFGSFNKF